MDEFKEIRQAIEDAQGLRNAGKLLSITELGHELGITQQAASDLVRRGMVDAINAQTLPRLITRASVQKYLKAKDAQEKPGRYAQELNPPRYDNS